ncbi:D-glycero-alpha-D-manno-heptose-1,7-bisphosphate 7-phosphatase [Candidatus Margulisiibacteriota bacterium]
MRVVFLDRDGVINKKIENGYVLKWAEFEFLPNIGEAIKLLNNRGIPVYLISNQSAVNRGCMSPDDLAAINQHMLRELAEKGAWIDDLFICPHRPDEHCDCRKPGTGLFEQAAAKHEIDFAGSWFIGDSPSDMAAGQKAGCQTYQLKKDEKLVDVIKRILLDW